MLPIALTCPVWWVARWTARTLATLAVLVACSFGAATLPLGGPATAPVAATVVASAEGLPLRADAAGQLRAAADPATAGTGQDVRGEAVDAPALPAGQPWPAAPAAVTRAAGRSLALTGLAPATVGSRAPPAR
ncbi:hypothetical protein [Micromonospora sp. MA102]|uniref:hypothetical protein n=1 Tax=Micromonospora sp. MA102 TaxID=2952755 RepID=UPI0021C5FD54|nr:hypothetical protein [Micromonospora sp. MA102]